MISFGQSTFQTRLYTNMTQIKNWVMIKYLFVNAFSPDEFFLKFFEIRVVIISQFIIYIKIQILIINIQGFNFMKIFHLLHRFKITTT